MQTVPHQNNVYIFDLDGTILRSNSFHQWIIFLLKNPLYEQKINGVGLKLKILSFCLLRAAKIISHAKLKYYIQAAWATFCKKNHSLNSPLINSFIESISGDFNQDITEKIKSLKNSPSRDFMIMATAAPAEYAVPLSKKLGFPYCIATPNANTSEKWFHCLRENKKNAVLDFLKQQGWASRTRYFYTDHVDDKPLADCCHHVTWVS